MDNYIVLLAYDAIYVIDNYVIFDGVGHVRCDNHADALASCHEQRLLMISEYLDGTLTL